MIKTDNLEAGRLAIEHLLSLGHRDIGIPCLATSDDRYAGYRKAFSGRKLTRDPSLALTGAFDQHTARDAAPRLPDCAEPRTAIVTISNMMTAGVLLALLATTAD